MDDYIYLDDWFGPVDTAPFAAPLAGAWKDQKELFNNPVFVSGRQPTQKEVPLTAVDRAWIAEKGINPNLKTPPPSYAAQKALDDHLSKFNFIVPGTQDQWQSYIMFKYFELSLDPDPKISKPALDALAKTSIVGLSVERQEISISNTSNEELDKRLKEALGRYAGSYIEGNAVRV